MGTEVFNQPMESIACWTEYNVALRDDGRVFFYSPLESIVSDWRNIISISAPGVGLKSDGTVEIIGEFDVSHWSDIVAVASNSFKMHAGYIHRRVSDVENVFTESPDFVIGLRADGTIVSVGLDIFPWAAISREIQNWTDIGPEDLRQQLASMYSD
jgi:hypothetical protein